MTLPRNINKVAYFTGETARMWIRMFAQLYKRGVQAAAELDDEGACREYLDATKESNVWGELTDRKLSHDPIDWQVILNIASREISSYQPILKYFSNMGRYASNWFSVALPCALDWYRMGIYDYIVAPREHDMAQFIAIDKPRWGKKKIEKLDIGRMVDMTQQIVRERMITDSEAKASRFTLTERQYIMFRYRIATASRLKFVSYYG